MSESSNEQDSEQTDGAGITDEQLPDDLVPSEENPLAEPLTDEEAPDDMDDLDMMGGGSEGDDAAAEDDGDDGEDGEPPPADEED